MTIRAEEKKNLQALSVGGLLILLVGGFFILRVFWNKDSATPVDIVAEKNTGDETKEAPSLSAEVIQQKILNGDKVVFLDARDKENFDSAHIPHSILTSPSALQSYVPDKDTLVVVVLSNRDASREEAVSTILKQKSYPAFILKGGIEAWQTNGNPIMTIADPGSLVDQSKISPLSPAEALKMIQEGSPKLLILDVQSEQNFQKKHIKGAINIPFDQLEKRSKEIPNTKTIIVYGETDLVSFRAGARLNDLSIFSAQTLTGNNHLKPESGFPLEP